MSLRSTKVKVSVFKEATGLAGLELMAFDYIVPKFSHHLPQDKNISANEII